MNYKNFLDSFRMFLLPCRTESCKNKQEASLEE